MSNPIFKHQPASLGVVSDGLVKSIGGYLSFVDIEDTPDGPEHHFYLNFDHGAQRRYFAGRSVEEAQRFVSGFNSGVQLGMRLAMDNQLPGQEISN